MKLENKIKTAEFIEKYHPLKYYYHLQDIGFDKEDVDFLVRDYEIHYNLVMGLIKNMEKNNKDKYLKFKSLIKCIEERRKLEYII